jgi:hypothetical protein
MSKTTKTILIVLGIIVLCCCVVGIGGYFYIQNFITNLNFDEYIVTDPFQIEQAAKEIAEYNLPAGYEESYSMDFFGFFQGVFITNETKGILISMIQLNSSLASGMEGYEEQFQESFLEQYQMDDINLNLVEQRTVMIRGKEETVQVFEGSDNEGSNYTQWVTTFEGNNGTVVVVILGNANNWNDAEVESFLTSIQ